MKLRELIDGSINLADDMLPDDEVMGFINDAISAINIEVDANFPFLKKMDDEPVFPEKWQRMLIIPFAKARIKEKDSSQFEWEIGYEQFFNNLRDFATKYTIPEQYKDDDAAQAKGSMLNNVPYLWSGW